MGFGVSRKENPKPTSSEQVFADSKFGRKTMTVWIDGFSSRRKGPSGSGGYVEFGLSNRVLVIWQASRNRSAQECELNALQIILTELIEKREEEKLEE